MRAVFFGVTLLTAFTTSVAARAEAPLWGYFVHDADGTFVTGDWPHEASLTFGSAAGADVVLPRLDAEHATIAVDGSTFKIEPDGEVWVDGQAVSHDIDVEPLTPVRLGPYRIELRLADGTYVEPPPPAPVLDDEGHPIIDYSQPPALDEAIARTALAREPEFARGGYRFCHDEDYADGGVIGSDFCAIFDASTYEVCPAVQDTCPWEELQVKSVFGRFSQDTGKGGKGSKGKRRKRKRAPIQIPALPPFVAYGVLALLIAIIVGVFVKSLMAAGWEKSEIDLAEEEIDEAMLDLQSLPEARSHVLLKLAERALARGEAEEGAILCHLAILRHLDDEGLARYHPSKTNGDYLRAIRRQKPLAHLFRSVANQTERVRFGDGFVDEAQLREQLANARTLLVPGSQIPITSAAAPTALILMLGLTSQSCTPQDDPRAFYSHGPVGMAAFVGMLRESGLTPEIKLDRLSEVPPEIKTIVFRTSASRSGRLPPGLNVDDLLDRGTSIVIIDDLGAAPHFLPGTSTASPSQETVDAVRMKMQASSYETTCARRLGPVANQPWVGDVKLPRGARINVITNQGSTTLSRDPVTFEPLIVYDETPGAPHETVAVSLQRTADNGQFPGCLYVFSDRDIFTNASLTREPNARFLGAFFASIAQGDERIWFVDSLDRWGSGGGGDGAPPDDPTKPLRASNLLPLLIQGLVTLALFYVFLGAAFGPLRDTTRHVRKSFVEHVEAIGRQYARCGLPGLNHASASLARLVVMRNRERVRGGGEGWAGIARDLAEKHDLPEEDVRAALRLGIEGKSELGTPKLEDPAPASERMLRTLSKLLGGRRAELDPPRRSFRRKKRSA